MTASWQLPWKDSRHGIIKGFKLFYKKKDSGPEISLTIDNGNTSTRVTMLDKFTEYEFQVLAFTSAGDGPNSSTVLRTTMEDASWQLPWEDSRQGIIKGFKLFYKKKDSGPEISLTIDNGNTSTRVTMLDKFTEYEFQVLAFTSAGDGPNSSTVLRTTMEDVAETPEEFRAADYGTTHVTLTWQHSDRKESVTYTVNYNGTKFYDKSFKHVGAKKTNSTTSTVIGLFPGTSYKFEVYGSSDCGQTATKSVYITTHIGLSEMRVFCKSSPFLSKGLMYLFLFFQCSTKVAETPEEFRAADYGTTHVTLTWQHSDRKESVTYTVNYNGTKFYDKSFKHVGAKKTNSTTSTVIGLFPGTSYKFEVYGSSDCGQTATKSVYITTHIMAPNSPLPLNMTDVEVSETAVDIYLWPVEQENGPIRSLVARDYLVIPTNLHIDILMFISGEAKGIVVGEEKCPHVVKLLRKSDQSAFSRACVDFDLGMRSGTIPDSNMTASSVQSASTLAKNGRLNYTSGSSWCARTSDSNPYLQINLQTLHIICAVSTKGNSQADQWVKNYTLQFSMNGTTWTDYKKGGQIKV
ncbi:Receptor-type tyrosine-protein phosphatase F [Stylophora pistillata]|uniref:Receptor-type tyrosine-protein phosphatase F n=1 Tax=Stylophora pistillata TaxID=50429 RepID=A0A2B4SMK2_STYPI|nr:Receptor-type tyrosine-protein phosphatase F [Stylophora pistillata]